MYSKSKSLAKKYTNQEKLSQIHFLLCGMVSGATVMLITNPIWMIKTRMQLQSRDSLGQKTHQYRHSIDAFKRMLREEGPATFYRGIGPALTLCTTSAIQMVFYEDLRLMARKYLNKKDNEPLSNKINFLMASMAKGVAAVITYPLMVMKSRLYQRGVEVVSINEKARNNVAKYQNMRHVIRDILGREGVRGFYSGLSPHLIKTIPASAITYSVYEYLVRMTGTKW